MARRFLEVPQREPDTSVISGPRPVCRPGQGRSGLSLQIPVGNLTGRAEPMLGHRNGSHDPTNSILLKGTELSIVRAPDCRRSARIGKRLAGSSDQKGEKQEGRVGCTPGWVFSLVTGFNAACLAGSREWSLLPRGGVSIGIRIHPGRGLPISDESDKTFHPVRRKDDGWCEARTDSRGTGAHPR